MITDERDTGRLHTRFARSANRAIGKAMNEYNRAKLSPESKASCEYINVRRINDSGHRDQGMLDEETR
jgi:hypothetical protein